VTEIDLQFEGVAVPSWTPQIVSYMKWALKEAGITAYEVSVLFCSDDKIAELNKTYRQKEGPTDVLSFVMDPLDNPDLSAKDEIAVWGDLVISLPFVESNANYFEVAYEEELRRVLLHGILHLKGLNHHSNLETEPMLVQQEEILKKYRGSLF
jgi:probable rRNA maturation factor